MRVLTNARHGLVPGTPPPSAGTFDTTRLSQAAKNSSVGTTTARLMSPSWSEAARRASMAASSKEPVDWSVASCVSTKLERLSDSIISTMLTAARASRKIDAAKPRAAAGRYRTTVRLMIACSCRRFDISPVAAVSCLAPHL